jgi:[ribosomal protein S18]-alanine N-acetyltransferase
MILPAGVVYRPLRVGDFAALETMVPPLLSGNWSATALLELLASPHHCRVLCSVEDTEDSLLGFVEFMVAADECELLSIAVDPEVQGCGLGRALLRAMLEEALGLGCVRCCLEVRRSNAVAIALYAAEGFELNGVRKGYYPPGPTQAVAEDALLYSRPLVAPY